jgi:hypothetical protein
VLLAAHSWLAPELVVAADEWSWEDLSFHLFLPLTQKSRCWSAMAEEESARLWQVNRTIHEMVKDRVSTEQISLNSDRDSKLANNSLYQGFQVSDEEIEMDLTQFRQLYANQMGFIECVRSLSVLLRNVD